MPRLGQTCIKLYTLFRTERRTMPWPAACPCIGHLRDYPPPHPPGFRHPQTGLLSLGYWAIVAESYWVLLFLKAESGCSWFICIRNNVDVTNKLSSFLQLAQRNTPIHPWHLPNLPKEFSLSIKRDDLTGSTLSGNKVQTSGFIWQYTKIYS